MRQRHCPPECLTIASSWCVFVPLVSWWFLIFLRLLPLGAVDFGGIAQLGFGAEADRFAERRVRVDRLGEIAGGAAHFDGEDCFGDQLAGAGADDAAAEDALGRRVDDQLRQSVSA